MFGISTTGDIAEPPRCSICATASSSFGTPMYITQCGGMFMPGGWFITPATWLPEAFLKIV